MGVSNLRFGLKEPFEGCRIFTLGPIHRNLQLFPQYVRSPTFASVGLLFFQRPVVASQIECVKVLSLLRRAGLTLPWDNRPLRRIWSKSCVGG